MPRAGRDLYRLNAHETSRHRQFFRRVQQLIEPCFGHCAGFHGGEVDVALLISSLVHRTTVTDGEADEVLTVMEQHGLAQALRLHRPDFPPHIELLVYRRRHGTAGLQAFLALTLGDLRIR